MNCLGRIEVTGEITVNPKVIVVSVSFTYSY